MRFFVLLLLISMNLNADDDTSTGSELLYILETDSPGNTAYGTCTDCLPNPLQGGPDQVMDNVMNSASPQLQQMQALSQQVQTLMMQVQAMKNAQGNNNPLQPGATGGYRSMPAPTAAPGINTNAPVSEPINPLVVLFLTKQSMSKFVKIEGNNDIKVKTEDLEKAIKEILKKADPPRTKEQIMGEIMSVNRELVRYKAYLANPANTLTPQEEAALRNLSGSNAANLSASQKEYLKKLTIKKNMHLSARMAIKVSEALLGIFNKAKENPTDFANSTGSQNLKGADAAQAERYKRAMEGLQRRRRANESQRQIRKPVKPRSFKNLIER